MKRQLTERIVAALVVCFLLAYVGYQAYNYINKPVRTDTVYEYTVSRTIRTTGIAVRTETVLDQSAGGTEYYPVEDGTRVALGETVVELGRTGRTTENSLKRARELESEIALLEEAQNTVVDFSNTEVFNRDIKQRVSELSAMAEEGRFEDVPVMRREITADMNKKQISNGVATGFAPRINQLQGELQKLGTDVLSDTGVAVSAPQAGYFSRSVDGYESRITPDRLEEMKVSDIARIIETPSTAGNTARVGKLVLSQNWTFAVTLPSYNLEWINEMIKAANLRGQKLQVELQFDERSERIAATVDAVVDERTDTAALLLGCNRMNEDLINLRISDVVIHFQQYTGLRINSSDLRFRQNKDGVSERGVYILRGGQVYFRLVDPVYEEAGFVLSKTYYTAEEYLEPQRQERRRRQEEEAEEETDPPDPTLEEEQAAAESGEQAAQEEYKRYVLLFDQVIIKGTDLYDGKTILEY